MKSFKLNYYNIFLLVFRLAIILESIYFLFNSKENLILYCALTFVTTFAVPIIQKFTYLNLSNFMKFLIQFFIFLSMFLGHINNMYHKIVNWDDILHIASGFILSILGYTILKSFKGSENLLKNKSFISFYIIIFGLACGASWEIYEFTTDSLFGLKSQNGSLIDTMMDMINGSIGPLIISIFSFVKPSILNKL